MSNIKLTDAKLAAAIDKASLWIPDFVDLWARWSRSFNRDVNVEDHVAIDNEFRDAAAHHADGLAAIVDALWDLRKTAAGCTCGPGFDPNLPLEHHCWWCELQPSEIRLTQGGRVPVLSPGKPDPRP